MIESRLLQKRSDRCNTTFRWKEPLRKYAIKGDKTSEQDLSSEVGKISMGEDLFCNEDSSFLTTDGVTGSGLVRGNQDEVCLRTGAQEKIRYLISQISMRLFGSGKKIEKSVHSFLQAFSGKASAGADECRTSPTAFYRSLEPGGVRSIFFSIM
jgi:hypothetical protein